MKTKAKAFETTQCSYDKYSYELIWNDFFLNILNVKGKTDSWPQSFHDINAFLTKVFFLPFLSNYEQFMQLYFHVFGLTIYWTSIGNIFSIQVGTNRTFYIQGAHKVTLAVNLVIADILEGLHVLGISTPSSSIPSWNAKSDIFCLLFFHFACNIFTMMVFYWNFIMKI